MHGPAQQHQMAWKNTVENRASWKQLFPLIRIKPLQILAKTTFWRKKAYRYQSLQSRDAFIKYIHILKHAANLWLRSRKHLKVAVPASLSWHCPLNPLSHSSPAAEPQHWKYWIKKTMVNVGLHIHMYV